MPRDRDGPSRIMIRRSCDTAPSHVVIRTIAATVPSAPDLGYQANDTRSRRPASADKSRGFRKKSRRFLAEPLGTDWWTLFKLHAFPRGATCQEQKRPSTSPAANSKCVKQSGRSLDATKRLRGQYT